MQILSHTYMQRVHSLNMEMLKKVLFPKPKQKNPRETPALASTDT
jgi:hypothetical protein